MVKKTDEKKTTKAKNSTTNKTVKNSSTTSQKNMVKENMIDCCTTDKTSKFCEPVHMTILGLLAFNAILLLISLLSSVNGSNGSADKMAQLQMSQFGENADEIVEELIELNKEYQDVFQSQFEAQGGIVEGTKAQLEQQRMMMTNPTPQPQFDLGDLENLDPEAINEMTQEDIEAMMNQAQ